MPKALPQHLAIIMDGNGRWAKSREVEVTEGHRAGSEKLREVVGFALDAGIPILSVYAFSTENWKRSEQEIQGLMSLIPVFFEAYSEELCAQKVKIHFVGDLTALPEDVQKICYKAETLEPDEHRLDLYICLNYGGRDEILRAVKHLFQDPDHAEIIANLQAEDFSRYFYCPDLPDPDLIIRTAGEKRLSNFWLWQAAYAEFYVTEVYWPDFSRADFELALQSYLGRDRRFGGRRT
ncbi:MAG: polyprenyl diphosphate synthase [Eubacteriales bacterium]|nr:polyprenyl diphosphate synthase [Eubacteriales bacterium]